MEKIAGIVRQNETHMPIGLVQPGYTYDADSVRKNAPLIGRLCDAAMWIYFGDSDNTQRQLLEHLNETQLCE